MSKRLGYCFPAFWFILSQRKSTCQKSPFWKDGAIDLERDDADFHAFQALLVSPVDLIVRVSDVIVDRIVVRFLHEVQWKWTRNLMEVSVS